MRSEFELIETLKKRIPRRLQGTIGIGDDAAVLSSRGADPWLLTTDVLVEGVDFIGGKISAEKVGRKALAVNLSDLAAMGAWPEAFVVSLGIPPKAREDWIQSFYRGMMGLAKKYRVSFVGGDLSRSKQFFASVALLGRAPVNRVVQRRGAVAGDLILVTGDLGGSILRRHYSFEPRLKEARFLAERFRPSAMIDISDGLVQDLGHILKASKAAARIDLEKIPVARDAVMLSKGNRVKALERSLSDGEDFELLFTLHPKKWEGLQKIWASRFPGVRLSVLGTILKGSSRISWYRQGRRLGNFRSKSAGYRHF